MKEILGLLFGSAQIKGIIAAAPIIALSIAGWYWLVKSRCASLDFGTSDWLLYDGEHARYFFDADRFLSEPENLLYMTSWMNKTLRAINVENGPISKLAFIEKSAGPIGMISSKDLITNKTKIPSISVRIRRRLISGSIKGQKSKNSTLIKSGEIIVIISDVATTGRTIKEARAKLVEYGAEVIAAIVLFDREEGAKEDLRDQGIELYSMQQRSNTDIEIQNAS